MEAGEALAADGIDAEVIDLRLFVPLDVETIAASARKTRRVVVASDPTASRLSCCSRPDPPRRRAER